MLPDGAAKGGNALKIRFGKDATRFSRDLDTARASSLEEYISRLESALSEGWHGFTGAVSRPHPRACLRPTSCSRSRSSSPTTANPG